MPRGKDENPDKGFVALDDGANVILSLLHKRAKERMDNEAKELLEWSRSLELHGLTFEAWRATRDRVSISVFHQHTKNRKGR